MTPLQLIKRKAKNYSSKKKQQINEFIQYRKKSDINHSTSAIIYIHTQNIPANHFLLKNISQLFSGHRCKHISMYNNCG